MAYRRLERKPDERSVTNGSTPATVIVANGSMVDYAFPCFYVEIPDGLDACVNGTTVWEEESEVSLIPIHLSDEGYTDVDVAFVNAPSGVTASGKIDAINDHVIRVKFTASTADAERRKIEIPFSVFVSDGTDVRDLACTGILAIIPGPRIA